MRNTQNEIAADNNMVTVNKLLLDMTQAQKTSNSNLVKVFIAAIICYTVLLMAMVIGFFVYEAQYDVVDTGYDYQYEYEQEAETGNNGVAIVNGNGEVKYAESEDEK